MNARTNETVGTGHDLMDALLVAGIRSFTGVPCSLLKGPFAQLESSACDITYIPAVREDAALAVAAGMTVANSPAAVFMQNSGLGYSLNVSTSLCQIYDIPVLLVISWRGFDPDADAVEHRIIGAQLPEVLRSAGISSFRFDPTHRLDSVEECVAELRRTSSPTALLIKDAL